ncbi:MAG: sensor histidine kinase [Gammaproteobacteria bacterium]|nr:sensor histidine kinase [Gammaproteobacteria bacterium]
MLFSASLSQAKVDVSGSEVPLVPQSLLIEDPENTLSLADVAQRVPEQKPHGARTASFGFTDSTHWFLVTLNNPEANTLQRLLVFSPTWLDSLDITLITPDGHQRNIQAGDYYPFSNRTLDHRNINFELMLPPGDSQLIVHTKTSDPYLVDMTLWKLDAFLENEAEDILYIGLLYGAVLAMLLYNLTLYISVREKVYAAYIGYLFFFLIMHATYNGHLYPLLWPDSPVWGNWAHSTFIYLFVISGVVFAINFLELRQRQPRAWRWAVGLAITLSASFLLTALGGYSLHVRTSILWVVFYAPYVLVLGVISLKAGNRAARFFLTAALAGFVGSFITAITVSGFIPYSYLSYHAVDIGMLIDAILLSIALADRLRIARDEIERAKAELLTTNQRYTAKLEETVTQRTSELRQANLDKDTFYSIVAHDLRGPIGGLDTLFNQLVKKPGDIDDETLKEARMATRRTKNLLEELLSWARSQKGEMTLVFEWVDVKQILLQMQDLFSMQAQNKSITLDLKIEDSCMVNVDASLLNTILRNLVGNALKFTPPGGHIHAYLSEEIDTYKFHIVDSGVGISSETQEKLFRPEEKVSSKTGTGGEAGTGLGLILCAEFVHKLGGEIGATSKLGEGSTFWFTLQKPKTMPAQQTAAGHR